MTGQVQPAALLFDVGGVVLDVVSRDGWVASLAGEVHALLRAEGSPGLALETISSDIEAARIAHGSWKSAMSRPAAPREMSHREYWADYVAADWPSDAHGIVVEHSTHLCQRLSELASARAPRDGIAGLLGAAQDHSVRMAAVSNTLMGGVHRAVLHEAGLDRFFEAQIYSDEVGVRKPNPEMIRLACQALAVAPKDCWFVGDNFDRDVLCGRRAGVGRVVLMVSPGTYRRPYKVGAEPDEVVDDPEGLRRLLFGAADRSS